MRYSTIGFAHFRSRHLAYGIVCHLASPRWRHWLLSGGLSHQSFFVRLEDRGFGRILDSLCGSISRCSRAERKPIWMKHGALWVHCWSWPWHILGAIRVVATVWEAGKILFFLVRWITHDFTHFPSAKFHKIWTQQGDRYCDENIWNKIVKMSP